MFIRQYDQQENGRHTAYWTLVESDRTATGPRQRVVAWLLTEAESAFRIHRSDLSIRPIWHQKEERVLAHILVCFLAYVLWKTLGQLCDRAGLGSEPRRVLSELSEIRSMDVVLPTRAGPEIRTRCISRPSDHQEILLDRLSLKLQNIVVFKSAAEVGLTVNLSRQG